MLTVATACGHTAAGGIAVRRDNGAGFSRRPTVRGMETATTEHLAPARVAGAVRSPSNSKLETIAFWWSSLLHEQVDVTLLSPYIFSLSTFPNWFRRIRVLLSCPLFKLLRHSHDYFVFFLFPSSLFSSVSMWVALNSNSNTCYLVLCVRESTKLLRYPVSNPPSDFPTWLCTCSQSQRS